MDTNVVVSALVSGNPLSPPVSLLRAMLEGQVRYWISPALLAEYREVSRRPHLLRRHNKAQLELNELRLTVAANGELCSPPLASVAPTDPGDQHIIDMLVDKPGSPLICGDDALRKLAEALGFLVLSPRQWVDQFRH